MPPPYSGIVPRPWEISLGKASIFPPVAAGYTSTISERLLGVTINGWLAPSRRPHIRFLFVRSGFRLGLPPHPASRRRSCLRLTIPVATARRELPPPRSMPCQAHRHPGIRDSEYPGTISRPAPCPGPRLEGRGDDPAKSAKRESINRIPYHTDSA